MAFISRKKLPLRTRSLRRRWKGIVIHNNLQISENCENVPMKGLTLNILNYITNDKI